MVAHLRRDDPLSISSAAGIDASLALTINTAGVATATDGLHLDNGATTTAISAPPLAPTLNSTPVVTTSAAPTPTPTDSTPVDANAAPVSATSTKPIALSTVIGSCVGAFLGAAALILLGLWFYRRYSQSLNKRRPRRGPQTRNGSGNDHRRRSHLEPWNKLEEGNNDNNDGDDKWEGMYQTKETKETAEVAPMEKLTMFKKTPSVRTAYTHRSTDVGAFDFPASYADFDPKLAETLTASQTNLALAQKPTVVSSSPTADNTAAATNSLVSVNTLAANNASRDMAIPTPPPTVSQLHRWESAVVVQPQTAETHNDSATLSPPQNPFFDLKDNDTDTNADENDGGAYARGRSPAMPDYKSPKARGKERMRYSDEQDPFDDLNSQMPPKPAFVQQHSTTASTSSTESKEKALQSLMAALELPEDEVRNRLRIASMQPSFISRLSSVAGDEDEDVSRSFPLPPSEARQ